MFKKHCWVAFSSNFRAVFKLLSLCVGSRRVFFNCEIVIEFVGQRWPRGATRSLSQRLRLSFEAFIS